MTLKTLALFSKPHSAHAWGALHEVAHWARQHGVDALYDETAYSEQGWSASFCEQVRAKADVALAIGGDGTLLGVARALFGWDNPLLGVNLGTLGFLTDVPASGIEAALDALLAGHYRIEDRILLEARLGTDEGAGLAFNDVVLSKGDYGQMVSFDVYVDGLAVYHLRADGLIVTTPTGSTAYALSANGPILHPGLAAVALVPINPHSLTARPITLPSAAHIEIVLRGNVPGRLHCDGQAFGPLLDVGTRIAVTQAQVPARLLHLDGYNVFSTLREKLGWGSVRAQ